jgi:hypothetical protein
MGGSQKPLAPKRNKTQKRKPPNQGAAFLFSAIIPHHSYDTDLPNPFLALPDLFRQGGLTFTPL